MRIGPRNWVCAPVNVGGSQLYFGLAGTNSTDGHAAIDFFDPNKGQFLEYDLAKLVYQLGAKKPVIGWLSELPMSGRFDQSSGQPRPSWVVLDQIQQLMDVRTLDNVGTIDPAINVLVLAHPKHLSTRPSSPSISSRCAVATSWRSSIHWPIRIGRAPTPPTPPARWPRIAPRIWGAPDRLGRGL